MAIALLSLLALCNPSPAATPEPPPLALHVHAFIREQRLEVEVAAAPALFPPALTDVQLTAAGPAGAALRQAVTLDARSGVGVCRLDDRQLPAGPLTLAVAATNRQTGRTAAAQQALGDPLHPAWLNTKEGDERWVPPPWTDIQVDGFAVKPWGRVYQFERSLLPTDITARAASVLAGPVRLVARIGGKTVDWRDTEVGYRWRRPDAVLLEGHATAGGLTLRGSTQVEYDGMLCADLELAPDHGPLTVESLTLELPLRRQHARYLYHYPGQWGSVANTGFLPAAGWKHAFKPAVWLGDEDRGLEWFCESDRNWLLNDPQQAITIDPQGQRVRAALPPDRSPGEDRDAAGVHLRPAGHAGQGAGADRMGLPHHPRRALRTGNGAGGPGCGRRVCRPRPPAGGAGDLRVLVPAGLRQRVSNPPGAAVPSGEPQPADDPLGGRRAARHQLRPVLQRPGARDGDLVAAQRAGVAQSPRGRSIGRAASGITWP